MSKKKSSDHPKCIKYEKIKKVQKNFKQNKNLKPVISLSKHNVSANWLKFMGPKGLVNKNKEENEFKEITKSPFSNKTTAEITKVIALDCEMVSDLNNQDMLARISLVNFKLECIYDKYVKPQSKVGDYRTRFSGIREENLMNGADFEVVRKEVKDLLYNRILVGHALGNDFKVLKFGHHKQLIRDTSKYEPFKKINDLKSPPLKKLAKMFLNEIIQEGEHDSIEDAKTAMKLYKKFRKEWETSLHLLTAPKNKN